MSTLITVEQFARLETADRADFELVDGGLIPLPSGLPAHADLRDEVAAEVRFYLRSRPIGRVLCEVDCQLSPSTVRRPDISIFVNRAVPMDRIPIPFGPDIAVEVLSPSERAIDSNRKVLDYIAAGAAEVWVIDRENREVFVSTPDGLRVVRGEGAVLECRLLPGFGIALSRLFPPA